MPPRGEPSLAWPEPAPGTAVPVRSRTMPPAAPRPGAAGRGLFFWSPPTLRACQRCLGEPQAHGRGHAVGVFPPAPVPLPRRVKRWRNMGRGAIFRGGLGLISGWNSALPPGSSLIAQGCTLTSFAASTRIFLQQPSAAADTGPVSAKCRS